MIVDGAAVLIVFGAGFLIGAVGLYVLMVRRIWTNDDRNDDSNFNNPSRALNHFVLHPCDYQRMYYLSREQFAEIAKHLPELATSLKRPLWYMGEDEFEGVVKSRPD